MTAFSGTVFMWVEGPAGPVPQLVYFDDYKPDKSFKPLYHWRLRLGMEGMTLTQLAAVWPYPDPAPESPPTEPALAV